MSIQKKFESMLAANAFEELASYKEPLTWQSMNIEERELLGVLFVKQGEHLLNQGDSKVLESFDLAKKVAPHSSKVFYLQGLVYASQGQNIRCLKAADAAFKSAISLDPLFAHGWHSWGNILVRIGIFYDDPIYFQQADEKFKEVELLTHKMEISSVASLYWHWGVCWYHLGKHSGEVIDLLKSLEKFRMGDERGFDSGEFHNDYGNILIDLATLMGREELFIEAADRYEKAISFAPSNYEGWLNLGCTCQRLYDFSGSKEYFYKAEECFERSSEIFQEDPVVWLRWAELYVSMGKTSRHSEYLEMSFEKFRKAESIEPNNPFVMMRVCEAQVLFGSMNENLELIREAEGKIALVLKALPHQPEAWYVYGFCLSEFGRYFAAEEYYFQAVDKFKRGLELKRSHPLLLQGIALAYFSIGEMKSDVKFIEKSIEYFAKVENKGGRLFSQFLSDWGVALMKLGEMTSERSHIDQAAAKFEQAISGRLDSIDNEEVELDWLYNYGCALDFLGDFHDEPIYYEKAIQVLSHVLKLDPDYLYARYNLALAFSHLGELKMDVDCFYAALQHFEVVLSQDSEDEIAWNDCGLVLLNLAMLVYERTQPEKAQAFFNEAEVKLQQAVVLGSLHTYYNLACLYALTYHFPAALYYLEKAELSGVLPPAEDVIHDEWLDGLRNEPEFRLFISRLISQQDENNTTS